MVNEVSRSFHAHTHAFTGRSKCIVLDHIIIKFKYNLAEDCSFFILLS